MYKPVCPSRLEQFRADAFTRCILFSLSHSQSGRSHRSLTRPRSSSHTLFRLSFLSNSTANATGRLSLFFLIFFVNPLRLRNCSAVPISPTSTLSSAYHNHPRHNSPISTDSRSLPTRDQPRITISRVSMASSSLQLLMEWQGKIVPQSFNAGFVTLSYVVSLIGSWSTLELINRRTAIKGIFNQFVAFLLQSSVDTGS